MQKWNGSLLRKFDDAIDGNASVGTTIVVRNTVGNTIAVIYDVDDTNSVQKNNPFVTDDFGRYSFFAPNGKYTIEFGDGSDDIEIVLVDNLNHNDLEGRNPSDGTSHNANDIARGAGTVDSAIAALEDSKMVTTLAEPINGLRPFAMNAIVKTSDTEYLHYTHLGGKTWQVGLLQNSGLDTEGRITPFGWNQTVVEDMSESLVYGDAGVTQSGTWTDLSTVNATPYYGHRAAQSTVVGDYIEISFSNTTDGASLSLIYNSRIEGNIVDVTIDGATTLLNESTTVDTYSATSLYRQTKLLASNLPAKATPYVIRFTLTASKNPSASTAFNIFGFNGLNLSGGSFGMPWNAGVRPKPFKASTPVIIYEEVIGKDGAVYVCTVAGTTGTSAPSHASGSASNGTATFLRLQQSSFILNVENSDKIQAQGSQLEYAYEFKKSGDPTFQDVGGNLHGNEYLTSGVKIYADGESRPITTGKFIIGSGIQFVQNIKAYYGTSPSHVGLADTVLVHSLTAGKVIVSHEHKFLLDGNFGYFYSAMWPQLAYNAVSFKKVFDTMNTPQFGDAVLTTYAGISNPIVGNTNDLQMTSVGEIYRPLGAAGVPSTGDGKFKILTRLKVTPASVNNYQYSTGKAGIATNLSGTTAMTGYSSWAIKKYFSRSNTGTPEPILTGDVVRCEAEYSINLIRKY